MWARIFAKDKSVHQEPEKERRGRRKERKEIEEAEMRKEGGERNEEREREKKEKEIERRQTDILGCGDFLHFDILCTNDNHTVFVCVSVNVYVRELCECDKKSVGGRIVEKCL